MKIRVAKTKNEREDAFQIRRIVFVQEQYVPLELEIDHFDDIAIHFIGYEKERPIAASRLRFIDNIGKLERICVLKPYRGRSFGKQVIKTMEEKARDEGCSKVKLNAQTHATEFYEKMGYQIISEEFLDAGIPHVTMTKNLS